MLQRTKPRLLALVSGATLQTVAAGPGVCTGADGELRKSRRHGVLKLCRWNRFHRKKVLPVESEVGAYDDFVSE